MTTLFRQALRSGWVRVGAVVLSALAIGLPIAASAASSSTASESKDTAAFRKEFVSYLTQMQQVGAMLQSSPRGRAALTRLGVKPSTLVRSRDAVQHMTPSELVVLQKAFASVPGWQTHPRDLKAALRRNGFSPNGPVRAFAVGPDCDPGPGSPLGITDWYIAVGVALALEIAHEAIPDDIITSIAQVAAAGLWGIAATAALALESVNGVENECNDAKLEDFTRTQLDVAVSTRATQTSVDAFVVNFNTLSTLVNSRLDVAVSTRATQTSVDAFTATLNNLSTLVNSRLDVAVSTRATQASLNAFHNEFTTNATTVNTKLDGITSSVATANSKLDSLAITVGDQGALALRLQIEADLSEPGNHPVALFEVPASGGGYLDLTRSIVADTIAKMQTAGQGVGNAQAFLAAGDAARAAQDYKGAYADYGKAYRAAAM
jgi:hypothetical protein